MKVLLNVVVENIENDINRQIIVDDNLRLSNFCEMLILSFNGEYLHFYEFLTDDNSYSPVNLKDSLPVDNIILKDLKIKKGQEFDLEYNVDKSYIFNITVDRIYDDESDNSFFKVMSGKGFGIYDKLESYNLRDIYDYVRRGSIDFLKKSELEILQKKIDIEDINDKINHYFMNIDYIYSPKSLVLNVSLEEFGKDIKRKIIVNDDILISDFCENIVLAMNGDLSHMYSLKINGNSIDELYESLKLKTLFLQEKQKLKLYYDFGDGWIFNITVSKINNGYNKKTFEVISGKGYGIIEDCGGNWGLYQAFYDENPYCGHYDINDFDLEKCNKRFK